MCVCVCDDLLIYWISVVTVVHDDTDSSIQEGVKDSYKHFKVISIILRI